MKRNRRPPAKAEQTDDHFLAMYHQLPLNSQREFFRQVQEEWQRLNKVIAFDELLSDPPVLEELRRLSRSSGIHIDDLARVVNPGLYSAYFGRSAKCTVGRISNIDFGRLADVAEVTVFVKAYRTVLFEHTLVPAPFDIWMKGGALEVHRDGRTARIAQPSLTHINAGTPLALRAQAGTWFTYSDYPLTAYIRGRAADHALAEARVTEPLFSGDDQP